MLWKKLRSLVRRTQDHGITVYELNEVALGSGFVQPGEYALFDRGRFAVTATTERAMSVPDLLRTLADAVEARAAA